MAGWGKGLGGWFRVWWGEGLVSERAVTITVCYWLGND